VTDAQSLPAFVAEVEQLAGPISVLVNNAGRHLKKHSSETTDEEFFQVINTNLLSVFALSREVANRMVEHQIPGSIIMITSMAAIMGIDRVVAYTTAKTGMVGLMRGLMADYARYGIRINSIAPGWIETNMSRKALENDPPRMQKVISRIPVAKMGKPSDIGNAALFLAADASAYINGAHLPVDGGAAFSF
jgi:gluconate 5-dehydrogenase